MKNYTWGTISEVADFESTIRFPKFNMAEKKSKKTLDFRKSEYTRVFGFVVKNYTRRFSKSLISNPLSDFQNSIWRKKLEKSLDFHKSEYTRVFEFAVKNYTWRFSKLLISNPPSD